MSKLVRVKGHLRKGKFVKPHIRRLVGGGSSSVVAGGSGWKRTGALKRFGSQVKWWNKSHNAMIRVVRMDGRYFVDANTLIGSKGRMPSFDVRTKKEALGIVADHLRFVAKWVKK